MVDVTYTGSGKLKLVGTDYDALASGETRTIRKEVAEQIAHRDDVEVED